MIIDGVRAVAVYNPSDGTTVQIPNIVANAFDFTQNVFQTGDSSPSGGRLHQADHSSCSFQYIDTDGSIKTQLESWINSRTRVSLVAVGMSRCVQWYETDLFTITRLPLSGLSKERGDVFDFQMQRIGHGRHAIHANANLLAHINGLGQTSWQNNSGTALGYTSMGSGTLSWDVGDNSQSVDHNAEDAGIYADIVFPVQLDGFALTLTSDIVDLHSETGTAKIQIASRNFADSQVDINDNEPSSTGRSSVSITTSVSNALYTVRVYPILTPSGVSILNIVEGRYPVLMVDSNTAFTDN